MYFISRWILFLFGQIYQFIYLIYYVLALDILDLLLGLSNLFLYKL